MSLVTSWFPIRLKPYIPNLSCLVKFQLSSHSSSVHKADPEDNSSHAISTFGGREQWLKPLAEPILVDLTLCNRILCEANVKTVIPNSGKLFRLRQMDSGSNKPSLIPERRKKG